MIKTTILKSNEKKEFQEKRVLRIKEALSFSGTIENKTHNVITVVNGFEVYFDKPGKEFSRKGTAQNINDMSPGVGNLYFNYSFQDIWKDLLNISLHINKESYKALFVIIYRLAYLMDCKIIDNKVRFEPNNEIMEEINNIQKEINNKKIDFKVLEFLHFLDLLAWNEDVKYQSDMIFENKNKGRINNLLSMISVPLIFKLFADNVIEHKDDIENIDFTKMIDVAQTFARTRGVSPLSNKALLEYLSPFLVKE